MREESEREFYARTNAIIVFLHQKLQQIFGTSIIGGNIGAIRQLVNCADDHIPIT